jgi:NitT/TauT family transport system substrate-binding protein
MTRLAAQRALDAHHDDPAGRPVMRARFEENGSPRYVLYTIKKYGFDHDAGFHLDVELVADDIEDDLETVEAKLQHGDADLIDIDYVSTARERADGAPIVGFSPYGRTVGGLVVPADSPIERIADLGGHRVGVVRRLDKNWILTRAACREYHDYDPDEAADVVEAGSKSGLTAMLEAGEVDAALQFWQLIPAIVDGGDFREVLPMADLVQRLSETEEKIPVSTFLTTESYLDENPEAIRGFRDAYRAAVARLRADDALWRELGDEMMDGADESVVTAVRDGWREMVVRDWNAETIEGMHRLFDHLHDVAGTDVLGVDQVPEGTFRLEV